MNGRSDRSGMRGSEAGEVRVAELVGKIGMVGILGEVFTLVWPTRKVGMSGIVLGYKVLKVHCLPQ